MGDSEYERGFADGVAAALVAIKSDPEIESLRRDMAECDCQGRGSRSGKDHDPGCMLPVFNSGVLHAAAALSSLDKEGKQNG